MFNINSNLRWSGNRFVGKMFTTIINNVLSTKTISGIECLLIYIEYNTITGSIIHNENLLTNQ